MQRLKLEKSGFVPREEISSERVLKLENDHDLLSDPVNFGQLDVILLTFPAFKDGRAFSQARELREQGFHGDIRAAGALFRDQIGFAVRCGFTSFDFETSQNIDGLWRTLTRFTDAYQRVGENTPAWEVRS